MENRGRGVNAKNCSECADFGKNKNFTTNITYFTPVLRYKSLKVFSKMLLAVKYYFNSFIWVAVNDFSSLGR